MKSTALAHQWQLARNVVLTQHLKQLVFKSHVRFWFQPNASAEDVGERSTLLSEGVDDGSARRGEWGLCIY
jgi:hypothetical protein